VHPGFWTVQQFRVARALDAILGQPPLVPPAATNDGAALRANHEAPTLTWVGHSTFLIQLDGVNALTDPQWSERASPVSFAGPRRVAPPGLAFEDLPHIDVVLISHDHYDHLDLPTVRRLASVHRPRFLVPLGLRAWFEAHGVAGAAELDWWQSHRAGALAFTATPAQHWSARTLLDIDRRLWAGWAVAGRARRLFFAGDTGYWPPLFREIRRRLGPFDAAAVAIGAYAPPRMMRMTHTTPEEALAVAADVEAGTLVAMHWGTFVLSDEPFDEPPRRLAAAAHARGLDAARVWVLRHGETRAW